MPEPDLFAGSRVCVAGHRGMVGAALMRALAPRGAELLPLGRAEADLRDQAAVNAWFDRERPDFVFLAAARVGGIAANSAYPAEFLYDNLMIAANVIHAAARAKVRKLLFLGSSCIYPKFAPQPMPETALLTGPLEPTNRWYAIAKIAGLTLAEAYREQYGCDFISAMPTNLYGPGDNFDPETSHVLPALLRKMILAADGKAGQVEIWGSGTPLREFLHVDDCAEACLFLMEHYSGAEHVNVGSGEEISIAGLAGMIAEIVGFEGALAFDASRPDGTPRKLLDAGRIHALGWRHRIGLREGIAALVGPLREQLRAEAASPALRAGG